jgi:hypothetical protein
MNPFFRTLRENLAGAFEVMMGRPEGLNRIDTSLDGFWRSFGAIVLVLPFAAMALISQWRLETAAGAPAPPLTGGMLGLYLFALLVDWISFPLVFALVARPFGLGSRYVPFIVTRNWASVILGALAALVHLMHLIHLIPAAVMPYALLGVVLVSLRLSYVIVRATLLVSIGMALPIVILDFLVSLVVWSVFERLM